MYGFRNPKTRQEQALSLDPEHRPFVRAKRFFRNLPDAWDDIPRGRRGRSDRYKNHRKGK